MLRTTDYGLMTTMKIAVFLPNWVGDVVMATPALRAIREHFADAYLIGVLKPYVAGVLDGLTWLDRLIFRDTQGPWSRRKSLRFRNSRFAGAIFSDGNRIHADRKEDRARMGTV